MAHYIRHPHLLRGILVVAKDLSCHYFKFHDKFFSLIIIQCSFVNVGRNK